MCFRMQAYLQSTAGLHSSDGTEAKQIFTHWAAVISHLSPPRRGIPTRRTVYAK